MGEETYIAVACRLKEVKSDSVWIAVGSVAQRDVNIPRTLLHGADETTLDSLLPGTPLRLRVMDWKARQLGLDNIRDDDAAIGDMFEKR